MMETLRLTAENEGSLPMIAEQIFAAFPDERIFAFYGDMGAGKTTFIKVLCRLLGVENVTSSPSFAIVNEYVTKQGAPIYHFDFYRINSLDEAIQIGFDDYLLSGNFCFIEWTEQVEPLLRDAFLRIDITETAGNGRLFEIRKV